MVNDEHEMVSRYEVVRFPESGCEFFTRDADVGDVESVLCELGAGEDETPVSVGRYGVFGTLPEKTSFFGRSDIVAEAASEGAGKGLAV